MNIRNIGLRACSQEEQTTTIAASVLRRVSIEEALAAMDAHPIRQAQVEPLAVGLAEGRILAQEALAAEDVPPFDRSPLDGFALVAADVARATPDHPVELAIAGEVSMGAAPPAALGRGQAFRIPTGGAIPPGATGVVMVEKTRERDGRVQILDGADADDNIVRRGSDVTRGQTLLPRGARLSPAAIGMLAGAGLAHVEVYARPVVTLIVTGDELVPPGDFALAPGEIRDINGISLNAALTAMGLEVRVAPRVPDRRDDFERALSDALALSDAVVISGGSSAGERDYTPDVVGAAGAPGVIVHGVRAKPGRPTVLAVVGDRPVIGLPGNPVSALVMLETLARPILWRMFPGREAPLALRVRLVDAIERDQRVDKRVPVKLSKSAGGLDATPILGTSAQMHILGTADALVTVSAGPGIVAQGEWVEATPLSSTGGLH